MSDNLTGLPDVIAAVRDLQARVAKLEAPRSTAPHTLAGVTRARLMSGRFGRVYHCTCGRAFLADVDKDAQLMFEVHVG